MGEETMHCWFITSTKYFIQADFFIKGDQIGQNIAKSQHNLKSGL